MIDRFWVIVAFALLGLSLVAKEHPLTNIDMLIGLGIIIFALVSLTTDKDDE